MQEILDELRIYLKERNWDNLPPESLAKSISIEAAELLEVFQWKSYTRQDLENNQEKFTDLKSELADVLIYCFEMCIMLDLDPKSIVLEKLNKVKEKYPANKVKNNSKNYYQIKQDFRENKK